MEIYWFIDVKYEESFAVMRLANIKKKSRIGTYEKFVY